jgi:hypothetical protein
MAKKRLSSVRPSVRPSYARNVRRLLNNDPR